MPGISHL